MSFSLDGQLSLDAQPFLRAVKKVREGLAQVGKDATGLPEAEVEVTAKDEATGELKQVAKTVDGLDGDTATVRADANDQATPEIRQVASAVDQLDGDTATVRIDASGADSAMSGLVSKAESLPGPLGSAVGKLGAMPGPVGVAAAGVAAMVGGAAMLAKRFADAATEVGDLADLTGDSLDSTSRLVKVWKDTGGETEDIRAILISMNGALQDNEELAARLGINMDDGRGAAERFTDVVAALETEFTDAGERGKVASELFGEDDQARVSAMVSRVGDLGAALEGVDDASIITDADLAAARQMNGAIASIGSAFDGLLNVLGRAFLPMFAEIADGLAGWVDAIPSDAISDLGSTLATVFGLAMDVLTPIVKVMMPIWAAQMKVVSTAVGALSGVVGFLREAWGSAFGWIMNKLAELVEGAASAVGWVPGLGGKVEDAAKSLRSMADSAGEGAEELEVMGVEADDAGGESEDLAAAAEEAAEAEEELAEQAEAAADELKELTEALEEQVSAMRGAADAGFAVRESQRAFTDAAREAQEVLDSSESSAADQAAALDKLAQASIKSADAHVRQAQETATARGETLSGAQSLDVFNQSLLSQASSLTGPARRSILDYVGSVNGIPESKVTEIEAMLDRGDIAGAERELVKVSRARDAQVRAQASTAAAEKAANHTARGRSSTLTVNPNMAHAQHEYNRLASPKSTTLTVHVNQEGRITLPGGQQAMADGGYAKGGLTLVGEEGPELVMMPRGAFVHPADDTRRLLTQASRPMEMVPGTASPSRSATSGSSGGSSSTTVNVGQLFGDVTVTGDADIDTMLAKADRMIAGWAGQ